MYYTRTTRAPTEFVNVSGPEQWPRKLIYLQYRRKAEADTALADWTDPAYRIGYANRSFAVSWRGKVMVA